MQTLFFAVAGVITVLTYLKAKKTLLQPVRTEVFREQLKLFSELLGAISGKTETEIREEFGFDKLFFANATLLLDSYAAHFFDIKVDPENRPYSTEACPGSLIPEHLLELDEKPIRLEPEAHEIQRPSPETKAAIWARYKFEVIKLPREFDDKDRQLEHFLSSPLMPKKLNTLLSAYRRIIQENVTALGRVLSACAQELPEKYPNVEALKKASLGWISNRYNDKFKDLETPAGKIADFVRTYLGSETLMD